LLHKRQLNGTTKACRKSATRWRLSCRYLTQMPI